MISFCMRMRRIAPGATSGKTLIYMISDDNYNPLQKTLLLMFELME